MTERIREFLRNRREDGPCVVVDLEVVRDNYSKFARALPDTRVFYAVKANPEPQVLKLLAELGSCFDTASVVEIQLALDAGATPDRISFGNTIKKERDIVRALELGVRLYAVDCEAEVEKIARAAETAGIEVRGEGVLPHPVRRRRRRVAALPQVRLRARDGRGRAGACLSARASRLTACRSTSARSSATRKPGIRLSAPPPRSSVNAPHRGIHLSMVNLGGGFPTKYLKTVPMVEAYGESIFRALSKHFGNRIPETIIEPGRGMVGNAGIIEAEVVLVSKKSRDEDEVRWVYLDIGKFGGLAETMDESIRYPIRTERDDDRKVPCVLAGPTCDSADVSTRRSPTRSPSRWRSATRC